MAEHTLIVGLGSPHGDDRLGWLVIDRLAAGDERVTGREGEGENAVTGRATAVSLSPPRPLSPSCGLRYARTPLDILDWLQETERLIVCDAAQPAGRPGRVCHLEWPDDSIRQLRSTGTHDVGLSSALELAARMDRLPGEVTVWTVEAKQCGPCDAVSPEVEAAVPQLVAAMRREVDTSLSRRPLNRTASANDK